MQFESKVMSEINNWVLLPVLKKLNNYSPRHLHREVILKKKYNQMVNFWRNGHSCNSSQGNICLLQVSKCFYCLKFFINAGPWWQVIENVCLSISSGFKTSWQLPDFGQLLDCMSPATPDPPCFRGFAVSQLLQPPTFPGLADYFKTFWNTWKR